MKSVYKAFFLIAQIQDLKVENYQFDKPKSKMEFAYKSFCFIAQTSDLIVCMTIQPETTSGVGHAKSLLMSFTLITNNVHILNDLLSNLLLASTISYNKTTLKSICLC